MPYVPRELNLVSYPQPSRDPLLDTPPAIVQQQPGLSGLQTFASGGNVADTSGLSGLRSLPDYGFGPMTPTTIAGYPNSYISATPDPIEGLRGIGQTGAFPVLAHGLVDQFDAAGSGIADAINDPSLANITNAGVNTGLALMSPELTIGSGLGGLGLAALRDANVIPSANARTQKPVQQQAPSLQPLAAPEVDPVLEKIKDDPSLIALYQQIKVEQNNATRDYPGRNGDASRAEAAARVKDLQSQFAGALASRDAARQGIYDQQVHDAIAARDMELGRDRRFSDTEVGKVYGKLGGWAPLVAGMVPGVTSRLAYGPAKTWGNAALRDLEGAVFGIGANNVPLAYNAFSTEVDNPEQRAYSAYAYNLPEGHPDKIKAQERADTLPKLNPVREAAREELYDPQQIIERAIQGGAEGWGGNRLGQMIPGGIGGIFRRSSYKLPPEPELPSAPAGPKPLAPLGASEELAAGKDAVLRRSSDLADPAPAQNLPVLGGVADTPPVTSAPARKPRGARRSKSAGSKDPSGTETILPALGDTPVTPPGAQEAAADELSRFFKKGPSKYAAGGVVGFATGGRVSIDEAAKSVSPPTEGQKSAGNYKKAHVRFQGLDIAIENARGSERSGVDKGGKRWSVNMPDHYGYIKRTEGKDGDHVDCYIGPNEASPKVFIVDQKDASSGRFDEHKCMLGYASKNAALDAYKRAFSDGKGADRIGHVTSLTVDQFKKWVHGGDTTKPAERQKFATGGAVHAGPLLSDVAGRTDHLPIDVTAGSYVIPADIVSAIGEGNTLAGTKVLEHMFPKQAPSLKFASGGSVPIMAAGGEVVLSPEQVAAVGRGDINHGHSILDAWVKNTRNDTINTLKALPGPQT